MSDDNAAHSYTQERARRDGRIGLIVFAAAVAMITIALMHAEHANTAHHTHSFNVVNAAFGFLLVIGFIFAVVGYILILNWAGYHKYVKRR